jgi:hypothetical protein
MSSIEMLSTMNGERIVEMLKNDTKKNYYNEVCAAFDEADAKTKNPMNVILMLNAMQILDDHDPFLKGRGEIYVISQVTSGALDDKTKSYTTYTTQTFHEVDNGDFLGLGRNGMALWAGDVSSNTGKDPKEFIDFHIAVMESDKKSRDIASDLEKYKEKAKLDEIDKIIQKLSGFDPTQLSQIISLSKIAFDLIVFALRNDGDDFVGDFHDVLLRQQRYSPGRWPQDLSSLYPAGDSKLAYKVVVS